MKREHYINSIITNLSILKTEVTLRSKQGIFDINIHSEYIICQLLNLLWNKKLKRPSKINNAGIDLIDESNDLAVQITSNNRTLKIQKTLEITSKQYPKLKSLKIIILTQKQKKYPLFKNHSLKNFQPKRDIIDLDDLISNIKNTDLPLLQKINSFLKTGNPVSELTGQSSSQKPKSLTRFPSRPTTFIGRKKSILDIQAKLNEGNSVVLVNGIAGIGKTTIAQEFLFLNKHNFNHIVWVDCHSSFRDSLLRDIIHSQLLEDFTAMESINHRYKKVLHALANLKGNNLLIVDNINHLADISQSIEAIKSIDWNVILTSRVHLAGCYNYTINQLSVSESINLFYTHYKKEKNDLILRQIFKLIERHTLTIELLAKTAQNTEGYTLKLLSEDLERRGVINFSKTQKVYTTYNKYQSEVNVSDLLLSLFDINHFDQSETNVLIKLSMLPSSTISFREIATFFEARTNPKKFELNQSLNSLSVKGWITKLDGGYRMHQVIREIVRVKLEPTSSKCEQLIRYFTKALEYDPKKNVFHSKGLLKHAQSIAETLDAKDKSFLKLLLNLSIFNYHYGDYQNALQLAFKCYDRLNKNTEPEFKAVVYKSISDIYHEKGDLDKSLQFQKRAFKIQERVLRKSDIEIANTLNDLSTIYRDIGKLTIALKLQKRAHRMYVNKLPRDHPFIANSYNCLSKITQDQGSYTIALKYRRIANSIYETILPKYHSELASSYHNLSNLLQDMGRYHEALEVQIKANKIFDKIMPRHPFTAVAYQNLSEIYCYFNKLNDALAFQIKALEIQEKELNPNHYWIGISYCNLAEVYFKLGKVKLAKNSIRKSATILRKYPNRKNDINKLNLLKSQILLDS